MEHRLKCWPEYFRLIFLGRKTFEFRPDDRDPAFEVEDTLILEEWDPQTAEYTGRILRCVVLHISRPGPFPVPDGYCIMSLAVLP